MGTYTQPIFREKIAAPVTVAMEIGSRDGWDALDLRKCYDAQRVICMECNPEAIKVLQPRVARDPAIELVCEAAWNQDSVISFFPVVESIQYDGTKGRNIGASSVYRESGLYGERYVQQEITVPAVRIDTLCNRLDIEAIDLVCMDVQGAALPVLEGFGRMLHRTRYIIAELEFIPIYQGQALVSEVVRFLLNRDFDLLAVDPECAAFGNFLFARRDHAVGAGTVRV